MFGRSKPVVISYGRRRSRRGPPGWLLLLLLGIAVGAAGLWLLQEQYLPPRLTPEATQELRAAYAQADAERNSLKAQLAATSQQLEATLAAKKRQDEELAAPLATAQRLRDELAALIEVLPPDPRGGDVGIRAARFDSPPGALTYDVLLTREGGDAGKPLAATMQFSVKGPTARGPETTVELKPVEVSIGGHALVHGNLPLPEGVRARQVTVNVLDAASGKRLGMRIMLVR
jgi:multidrug efflux pump subunit AcrA (membrane-fusion protein)